MTHRSYSALTLLAVAGLASSLMACSKEEEKKAGWNCHSSDVPQGEVLRCTSAALTEDGTSQTNLTTDGYTGTSTVGGAAGTAGSDPIQVGADGTSATGTATGGTGSTTEGSGTTVSTDGTSAIGAGTGYGSGSGAYVPGAGSTSINSDATGAAGVIIYECFPGDTNPDCPPADAYDGMATGGSGGTSTGASLNSDGTASTGDGTATGTGGGAGSTTGTSGTQGTSDGTSATGSTTGGAGSTTGTAGSGTGGGTGGSTDGTALNSDGTSSTGTKGNGGGNGGGAGSSNKYPGPDECAYVPDLPYCATGSAGNSSDGTPGSGGAAGGATASTPDGATTSGTTDGTSSTGTKGNGNGNGGSGGNGSKSGTTGTGGTGGTGDTTGTTGTTGGTTDGTASNGPTGGGTNGNGSSTQTTGGGSSGGSKPVGKHYKCVKDGKGNKSCESIPDCPTGSSPSGGACIDNGSSNGGTGDGTTAGGSTPSGSTPSGSSTPGSSEVQRPSEGGCWVTGGGFIISKNNLTGAAADGHDNYGGNAKPMKDGRIQGHWNHVDHGTGNHAKGKPEYIVCRKIDSEPGPAQPGCKKGYCMNQVYFGGHAEWRDHAKGVWESGYWFDVVAKDHGEPGSQPHAKNEGFPDTYHFTIRKMDDTNAQASGTVVYEVGRDSVKGGDGVIVGGNIQIHPPNNGHPYTVNTLPSWVKFENPAQ